MTSPQRQARWTPATIVQGVLFAGVAVWLTAHVLRTTSSTSSTTTPSSASPTTATTASASRQGASLMMLHGVKVGEIGFLIGTSGGHAWVAPKREDFDAISSFAARSDIASATRMMNEKARLQRPNTMVRLLEVLPSGVDVRVEVAEGPDKGLIGWTWGSFLVDN